MVVARPAQSVLLRGPEVVEGDCKVFESLAASR